MQILGWVYSIESVNVSQIAWTVSPNSSLKLLFICSCIYIILQDSSYCAISLFNKQWALISTNQLLSKITREHLRSVQSHLKILSIFFQTCLIVAELFLSHIIMTILVVWSSSLRALCPLTTFIVLQWLLLLTHWGWVTHICVSKTYHHLIR